MHLSIMVVSRHFEGSTLLIQQSRIDEKPYVVVGSRFVSLFIPLRSNHMHKSSLVKSFMFAGHVGVPLQQKLRRFLYPSSRL